ncbi:MAG: enamine deaminase RidA [Rhodospirillales bacterium]|nr:enamine deaminase RidA [Rhodospirillales bacterium]
MVKRYDIDGINPTGGRFSQVGEIGPNARLFYLAGQTAGRPDGTFAADFKGQAEQVYKNIADVLKGCGLSTANIVKTTTYLLNPDDLTVWRDAQKQALGDIKPASTLLFISRLARPEYLIEVDVIAAKD